MLTFFNQSDYQDNIAFHYIYCLWQMTVQAYRQITGQKDPVLTSSTSAKEARQRRRYMKQLHIAIIFIMIVVIFFIFIFIVASFLSDNSLASGINTNYRIQNRQIFPYIGRQSKRHIYIDIGCFNGETIEYFIHFTHNSSLYEIYTFEPDPDNYRLCKKRLTQKKYAHFNINIIQKVAWIRDETVYFQTERGRQSRISLNITADDGESIELDAIDFSSWLARLVKPNEAKIQIKMSMPGAEVPVLEKMIVDDTLGLASKYEVEWTDRENPRIRAIRIYIQLMFDTYGFNCLYYTRLQDARKIFQNQGISEDITKYYDWKKISEFDALAHYVERDDVLTKQDV